MKKHLARYLVFITLLIFVGLLAGDTLRGFLAGLLASVSQVASIALGFFLLGVSAACCGALAAWVVSVWRQALSPAPGAGADDVAGFIASASMTVDATHGRVSASADFIQLDQWAREVLIFAFVANSLPHPERGSQFSYRSMRGYVSRPAWELFTDALAGAGVLTAGQGGTDWARGWSYARLRAEVKHGALVIPCPTDEIPQVKWTRALPSTLGTHSTHTTHAQHAEQVII